MPLNQDILEWMELLDNRHSYIHQPAFKQLKRTLIRQVTAAYMVDETLGSQSNVDHRS